VEVIVRKAAAMANISPRVIFHRMWHLLSSCAAAPNRQPCAAGTIVFPQTVFNHLTE
jgi:hypothetical protein